MQFVDILIAVGALAIVGGIVTYRIWQRKKGKPVGCACSGCTGCSGCPTEGQESES